VGAERNQGVSRRKQKTRLSQGDTNTARGGEKDSSLIKTQGQQKMRTFPMLESKKTSAREGEKSKKVSGPGSKCGRKVEGGRVG